MKTSVIILNWNGVKLLEKFLPAVVEHTSAPGVEVVVADNGSSDGSVEFVRKNFPSVRVILFSENHGFAAGYNKAIAATEAEYIVLLNSDVETSPGWLAPLVEFMDATPSAGACQPKIRSYAAPEMFEYAGAAGGYLDRHGYPYCRGRLLDSVERDEGQYDGAPVPVAWASGAALMVRREDYLRVGGLDESFFAHMEEIDLCCRMQGAGMGVYAVPASKVFHVGGASLNQGNPRKTYLNFRNNLLLLYKNTPRGRSFWRLFLRRVIDSAAFLMFVAKGDLPNARAVVKAHRDYRRMKRAYTSFPEKDFLPSLPGARRDILVDYYLRGKRK